MEEKPIKSNKKLKFIIIGLIIVLALIFAFKDVLAYNLFTEEYLMASIYKSFKEVNKEVNKTQTILLGDFWKESNTNELKLVINDISSSAFLANQILKAINGIELEINTGTDMENKSYTLEGKTVYKGKDLLSLDFKLDDTEILASIPELYPNTFMLPSKNLGTQWNQSEFGQNSSIEVDNSLDLSFSSLKENIELGEMDKETKEAYLNGFKSLTENTSTTKDGKEELSIGDSSIKHRKTIVTLDPEDVKYGLLELIEAFENDNRLEEWKKSLISKNQRNTVKDMETSLRNFKNSIKEDYHIDKIQLHIYTRKGKVIEIKGEILPDKAYIDEALKIQLGLLGEKSIADHIIFELIVGQDEGKMVVNSKNMSPGNKDLFTNQTEFTVFDYGDKIMELTSSAEIDLTKEENNLGYNLNILAEDDIKMDIRAKGSFKTSSKNIEYDLHDLSLTMEDLYNNGKIKIEASLFLSGRQGVKELPIIEEGEKVEVLQLLESDIIENLKRNIIRKIFPFSPY